MDTEFELELHKSKGKELTRLFLNKFIVLDVSTLFLFSNCQVLKMLFELLRVKLYRNDLKGNKKYFYS